MRITTRHIVFLAAVLLACVLGACSGDDEGTKAGGTGGPVTLRIGTDDVQGKPASNQIEEFARRVERLSDGSIRIKPVWHAAGDGPGWDRRVGRMVTSGELDMGLIPSRSWDTAGVTSLRALNAPFLITSDELVAEVVSGELAGELMSGLDEAGVVGLALFPEGMRHPFGLKKPLLGPDDYDGKAIRAASDARTVVAVFKALGATVNDEEPNQNVHAAMESSYLLNPAGTATGNVTFYPKVNSLVVNADVLGDLDAGQVEILERAATQTRDWAIETTPTDAESAKAFCERGDRIVLASEADIAALESATQPVTAKLERDEQTKAIIETIRELKQEVVSATSPEACAGSEVDARGGGSDGDGSSLSGVYRFELDEDDLRQAGTTDPGRIAENVGVFTFTMKDGEACWVQRAPAPVANGEDCQDYEVDGDRVSFEYDADRPDVYRFRRLANGDLKLTYVSAEPGEEDVARATAFHVWSRIGDAE